VKHQYVGDVNDFVKYGLIRALTSYGQRSSFIAWLLTPDDDGTDGRRLAYLDQPTLWRAHDPELFDRLNSLVQSGERSVDAVAASGILPGARFFSELVPQARDARQTSFRKLLHEAAGCELVFFDPDNGLEVASCPPGRRESSKYLLWRELADTYLAGHSVLIYQHFPRKPRDEYIDAMSSRIGDTTGACEVLAFRTDHVVFFLAPQQSQTEVYASSMDAISRRWSGLIDSVLIAVA